MENQTNNQMNSRIEANGGKPKKKKGKVIIIIIVLLFLMMSCTVILGSDDSSTTTTTKETGSEQEPEQTEDKTEEIEEEPEVETKDTEEEAIDEPIATPNKIQTNGVNIGSVITYDNCVVTVLDIQMGQDFENKPLISIDMEIENTSNETIGISYNDLSMYVDDYQVDLSIGYRNTEDINSTPFTVKLNPGRKAKATFRLLLPNNHNNASNIEIEFPGGLAETLFVKKNGEYLYGQQSTNNSDIGDIGNTGAGGLDESMYGNHQSLDGLSYVLNFEPIDNGNGADALTTIKDGSNNYQWVLYMEDERTGYLSYMEEYVEVGTIYFSMDGIEVESSEHPEFNGLYW